MGKLFLINESFETSHRTEVDRDKVFINFCKSLDLAVTDGDQFYGTESLHTFQYSYGTLFYDLFFKGWDEINSKDTLKGISSTVHSLFPHLIFAFPNYVYLLESKEAFDQQNSEQHTGYSGFKLLNTEIPDVYCDNSWHAWKCTWLCSHQGEIPWNIKMDKFLPNKHLSDRIILSEIVKHGVEHKINEYKTTGIAFHEEVLRQKGQDLAGYTREIGEKVLTANYYTFDKELTKKEREAGKNSLRSIYRLQNSVGRTQYISLDHQHGMFEYHNESGEHLGEFKFDGTINSKAEASHNFKTL
jgi:hypothetical protein